MKLWSNISAQPEILGGLAGESEPMQDARALRVGTFYGFDPRDTEALGSVSLGVERHLQIVEAVLKCFIILAFPSQGFPQRVPGLPKFPGRDKIL